jgi:plastocyanin
MTNVTPRLARGRSMRLALAAIYLLCATSARAAEITIKIDNFVFSPDTVTIKPGDVVTWQNADDIPHTVASSKPGAFRSKPLDTDDKYSFTFASAGTFEYFCGLHPHMKGKIIVVP